MIWLTFTTTVYRSKHMRTFLKQLLKLPLIDTKIIINWPTQMHLTQIQNPVPDDLPVDDRLIINQMPDYGPATKFIGAIQSMSVDPDDTLVIIDDDIIPNLFFVSKVHNIVQQVATDPSKVYGYRGLKIINDYVITSLNSSDQIEVLEAGAIIAFQKRLFLSSFMPMFETIMAKAQAEKIYRYLFLSDDLVLAFLFCHNNIKLSVVPSTNELAYALYSVEQDSLFNGQCDLHKNLSNGHRYKIILKSKILDQLIQQNKSTDLVF